MRLIWFILGWLSLGLGVLGIPLPFLPTVPLVLLSAFCFARSSPRFHNWLLNHPQFGPMIKDWQERGAIKTRAKRMATFMILCALLISIALGFPTAAILGQVVVFACVLTFIWSRPSA